jgi:hypothetical protein
MKRRRSIPRALRLRVLRALEFTTPSRTRRLARVARRLRDTFLGVMPNAGEIDAANDSEK